MTLAGAVEYYNNSEPRGEYVLILEGAAEVTDAVCGLSPAEHVARYMNDGMTERDAIKAAARDRGVPKNVVYNEYVKQKAEAEK